MLEDVLFLSHRLCGCHTDELPFKNNNKVNALKRHLARKTPLVVTSRLLSNKLAFS
ncbi:hypothetical protein QWZ16_07465 [Vibrio ostreicida]|uniref:Uncharacterized protein n=1 Tax=Vibrio ostreicida TaxID=526588 RepID=A0ABT8BT38_9VIBR|nr:hypothetical protein [Vibrio ostreicida]MDN3609539.1 hypothetical protein [Vibrio ostreicida]